MTCAESPHPAESHLQGEPEADGERGSRVQVQPVVPQQRQVVLSEAGPGL